MCDPVEDIEEIRPYIDEMFDLMETHNGVGLAAPQVGITRRFFLLSYGGNKMVCINPEIVKSDDKKVKMDEGCLSYPGMFLEIERPATVKVSYTDLTGVRRSPNLKRLMARAFQHELDHLNGVVYIERVESTVVGRREVSRTEDLSDELLEKILNAEWGE